MTKENKKSTTSQLAVLQKLIGLAMSFFVMLIVFACITVGYQYLYKDTVYPGVTIGQINASGMTPYHLSQELRTAVNEYKTIGFSFEIATNTVHILPFTLSPDDPDLSQELIRWEIEETSKQAFLKGRTGTWYENLITPLLLRIISTNLPLQTNLDETKLRQVLEANFQEYETPIIEPRVTWSLSEPTIIPGKAGYVIDYTNILNTTKQHAQALSTEPIKVTITKIDPNIDIHTITEKLSTTLEQLGQNKPTITLFTSDSSWDIPFSEYQDYIVLQSNEDTLSLGFESNWLQSRLEVIKETIDQPSQDARFKIENGRVLEFQNSQDGLVLDLATSRDQIQKNFSKGIYENELILTIERATIQTKDANDLGIREILGIGESDFSGSPTNRRINISVGAAALDGLIIKPGEEFSLLDALLPIDKTNGYLPELVIKGDKTIPEYGGGLCQIGTTTFRAALDSGLDITQRQNHSYRVRYYEPAGTDATIYDPAPDFRFLNDTENHILIQTYTKGDILVFEFWGTSDGRVATTTPPRIFNITPPPPTRYINTTDLEPGKIKCTESAHNGATAELDYAITYVDGTKHEETFTSYYRPWQEVCLRGIDPNASSTPITDEVSE